MKKYNCILALLLSLSIFLVITSLFLVSRRFISNVVNKNEYYKTAYNNIIKELKEYDSNLEYELDIKDVKRDINNYLNKNFDVPNLKSKIKCEDSNKKIENIYKDNIRFLDNINYSRVKSITYILTFIIVIITGELFNRTKNKHKIDYVLLISGIFNLVIYGVLFLFNNLEGIKLTIFNSYLHVFLFVACLEIFASILFLNENNINKIIKCKDKKI